LEVALHVSKVTTDGRDVKEQDEDERQNQQQDGRASDHLGRRSTVSFREGFLRDYLLNACRSFFTCAKEDKSTSSSLRQKN
jgi:hypothetical protein